MAQKDEARLGGGAWRCVIVTAGVLAGVLGGCASPSDEAGAEGPAPERGAATEAARSGTSAATNDDTSNAWSSAPSALRYAYVRARQAEGAADARYHVAREAGALVTQSPARGVSARYASSGVAVTSASGARGVLRTAGLRCDAARVAAAAAAFAVGAQPHRVERRLSGGALAATEWVESGPLGLEQGFEVASATGCAELAVEVDVEGLSVSLDGEGARLGDDAGALRYAELYAEDADGRALPTRLGARAGGLTLVVDTAGARFPVSVDPLVYVEDTRVTPTPGALGRDAATGDGLGTSVSIAGDTALVGALADDVGTNGDQGSVHVFVRAGGVWTLQAKLTANDGATSDWFGTSVSLSGDTALVGADADDVGASANQGSAYVFVRTGTVWSQQAKLTASDGATNDNFGRSVSVSGDTALVAAPRDDLGANADQGSAYVFVRTGTVWTQQAKLAATDGAAFDSFGASVSIAGDTALVGASQDDLGAIVDPGSAYVFVRAGGVWTEQAKLTASDGGTRNQFGSSVSLSGDTALVGAPRHNVGAIVEQGAAYVFVRTGGVWTPQAKLIAGDGATSDWLGFSVSISGDTALVGARGDDVGANVDQGSAYVFVRTGGVWSEQAKLTAGDGAEYDLLGHSVSISGDTALLGAPQDDLGTNADRGSAAALVRTGGVWTAQAQLTIAASSADDGLGFSVSVAGDTAVVGAPFEDIGANANQGAAYVFARAGGVWTEQARLTASDGAANDDFGAHVSISGDTAVVGAPYDDVGATTNQGSAYVFVRTGTVWTEQAQLRASVAPFYDLFGFSVSVSGDTAIVGACSDIIASADRGSAYVFVRSGTVWTQQAQLRASDGAADDQFGFSVSIAGDTALIGAPGDDVGTRANQGSAYAFVRSGAVWTQQAKVTASDGTTRDGFGFSVSLAGDTALVGAPYDDVATRADQGSAYVFARSGVTWTQQAALRASDGAAEDFFGFSVAAAGETALVGAKEDDVGSNVNQGSAYAFTRAAGVWSEQQRFAAGDGAAIEEFGSSVAISDITTLVGAPRRCGRGIFGNPYEGGAYFGRLLATNGSACSAGAQCVSGFCADGVCCNTACGGGTSDCQACSVAAGAATDGACGPTTGNACSDALACTTAEVCAAGTCTGTNPCPSGASCSEGGPGGFTCGACPAGTFSADGTVDTTCMPCAPGTWSSAGATSCTAWTVCSAGQVVVSAGSAASDRSCATCAPGTYSTTTNATACTTCPAGSFCTGGALAACSSGTFAAAPGQASCTAWSDCVAGQRVVSAGSSTADRACAACASGTFTSAANASTCSAWTDCAAGSFVTITGTASRDRTCATCAPGSYTSTSNAASCAAWSTCTAGRYESLAGSDTRDRTCASCDAGTFSATSNATGCAPCDGGRWSAAGAAACNAWTDCAAGTYVASDGTVSSDRACMPCAPESYSTTANATSCAAWSTCATGEYASTAGSSTRDRVCAPLTVCTADEFESVPASAASDRVCTACTTCATDEVEVSTCTATADTVCASTVDGGLEDSGVADGGVADGGAEDGGVADGGAEDGGIEDGGVADGGAEDGGAEDAGVGDGGVADGGAEDGGVADGGAADAGSALDAAMPPDAASVDAGDAAESSSGCGCTTAGAGRRSASAPWVLLGAALLLAVRRRARRDAGSKGRR
jgi:MYXO-CTERM domain-containing protein